MVELERNVYSVPENGGQVLICAVVNTNSTDCAIGFSFEVVISLHAAAEGTLCVYTDVSAINVLILLLRYIQRMWVISQQLSHFSLVR